MLVLKNGTIIDPASDFMGKRDIAIEGKNIVKEIYVKGKIINIVVK